MPTVEEALMVYLKRVNPDINITHDHHLEDDLNLDSLDVIELIMHMEEIFDLSVDDEDEFRPAETVGELIILIRNKYGIE